MRIRYIGLDNRTRVAEVCRVKFFSDGFQNTDRKDEVYEELQGPVIVMHTIRVKGGKRLTFVVPDTYDMEAAKTQLLEKGWLDLSCCPLKMENSYT